MQAKTMMKCQHNNHDICQLATGLANRPVKLDPEACAACQRELVPMAVNRVTAAIASFAQMQAGVRVDRELAHIATGEYNLAGYRLERYIHRWAKLLRIQPPENCGCDSWVNKMNAWGVDGSLERIDEITDQVFDNLKETYLAGITSVKWLTKAFIKQRIRACLKGRS